ISVLGSMTGVYKTEVITVMTPMLNSLLEQFSVILQPPVQPEDPDDWGIRMEVLKCLLQLVQNFPSLLKAQFSIIVAPLWQMVVSSLKVYQLAAIQGSEDPHSGTYDSDGAEKSLESFVIQLFELLLTIVGNSKFAKVFATRINELAYYTIAFLQITEEQLHPLTMILKNAPIDLVKAVFEICFHPAVQILLESHDHGEMQNATECLATFLSAGKQDLLGWGGDPGLTMKRLLDASYR
ncbi:importin-9-like, partial [Dioscorea cayenensis subsp. rotundata]|uniref:Importin-9-like n=1 Tax=Dioscorea cayennensis subsp. rotundata TaxID=55577 RepID=A0AB40BWP1_DIOCR